MIEGELTQKIIGAAIEVHRYWGPGLLESIYEKSLVHELTLQGLSVKSQIALNLQYKDLRLNEDYRLDVLVEDKVLVEIKAVGSLAPIHEAQLLTYMRLIKCHVGLLINFNELMLKNGIKRMVL